MNSELNTEQLVRDLKTVAHDAEELVKATAGEVSDKARDARARLAAGLTTAKETCQRWEDQALQKAKATDHVIRAHPYQSIGVAFGVGVLLGMLVGRR